MFALRWRAGALAVAVFGTFLYFATADAAGAATNSTLTGWLHVALALVYLCRLRSGRNALWPLTVAVASLAVGLLLVMGVSVLLQGETGGTGLSKLTFARFFLVGPLVAGLLLRAEDLDELLRLIVVLAVMLCCSAAVHIAVSGFGGDGRTTVWEGWNPISHALTLTAGALVAIAAGINSKGWRRASCFAAACVLRFLQWRPARGGRSLAWRAPSLPTCLS